MMGKIYHRWHDVRKKKLPPQQLEAIDRAVEHDLVQMDLRAIREVLGKTQGDIAEAANIRTKDIHCYD